MAKKRQITSNVPNQTGVSLPTKTKARPVGDVLGENTTLDIIISPTGYVMELSDTVDSMDGATTEVVDIISEADGTNIELTTIAEPSERPGIDQVDRFVEVKGIGPKVADLLVKAGIRKFSELAETPVERLREILSAAGLRYRIYDPASWLGQAKQLADSKPTALNSSASGQAYF